MSLAALNRQRLENTGTSLKHTSEDTDGIDFFTAQRVIFSAKPVIASQSDLRADALGILQHSYYRCGADDDITAYSTGVPCVFVPRRGPVGGGRRPTRRRACRDQGLVAVGLAARATAAVGRSCGGYRPGRRRGR